MKRKQRENNLFKKLFFISALCLTIIAGMATMSALAADTGQTDNDISDGDDSLAPSFSNPAQAQHAANLAEEVASQSDEKLTSLQSAVEKAEQDLNAAVETNAAEAEIQALSDALESAQEAYATEIAERIGVVTGEIEAMRETGMGWGEIAHELGVHPGLLGLGHTKREKNTVNKGFAAPGTHGGAVNSAAAEIAEATERNPRSGWSNGHGVGLNAGVDSTSGNTGNAFGHSKTKGGISGTAGLSGNGSTGTGNGQGGGRGVAGSNGGPGNSGNSSGGRGNNAGGTGNGNGNSGGQGGGNGGGHGGGHGGGKGR